MPVEHKDQDDHTLMVFKGQLCKIVRQYGPNRLIIVNSDLRLIELDLSHVDWSAYIAAARSNLLHYYPNSSLNKETLKNEVP